MKKIMKSICALAALALGGCVCLVFAGCQSVAEIERLPDAALPIQEVRPVNGVEQVVTVRYQVAGGGWRAKVRSPLWAREQLKGFRAEVATNGVFSLVLDDYARDLSTNAVVLTKTIFDGSANLAAAVAKAYATITTGGATDATASIVQRAVAYFKSRGGDEAKSTVTADPSAGALTITDGSICISCDVAGNCSDCSYAP
ncbi:MAG: hypothetical protein J6V72_21860 [Kiritimatiellae bacterium]|nr:hypothetical protein [Kiritimatiellia bacterium]